MAMMRLSACCLFKAPFYLPYFILHTHINQQAVTRAALVQAVQSKTCEACGLEKSASQFVPNRASKDGLARHCQDCAAAGADAPGGPAGGPAAPLRRPGRRARTPAAFPINEKVCRPL